jgi:hypothetical protein
MITKFGVINEDEIRMKLEVICQKPCQKVITYLNPLKKDFHKGWIGS